LSISEYLLSKVFSVSAQKGSWHPDMSDPSESLKSVAQWLTEFVFLLSWPPFMMFSISLNSRNALKCLLRLLNHKPLRSNLIYPTLNNPSKSLIPRRESPEERRLKCIRSYGIITPKKKRLGKLSLIFNEISQTSFKPIPKSNRPIPFFLGGKAVTFRYLEL
jgi:hypothetical protein